MKYLEIGNDPYHLYIEAFYKICVSVSKMNSKTVRSKIEVFALGCNEEPQHRSRTVGSNSVVS